MVSPQFSLLMLFDVLFAYYFANNTYYKVKKYKETMSAVQGNAELMEFADRLDKATIDTIEAEKEISVEIV